MKKADLKKLIEEAEIIRDREIKGTLEDGKPDYGKKLDNFQIIIKDGDEILTQLGVPAKSEAEAKENAYAHLTNPDIPELMRAIPLDDLEEKAKS